jgi:hypothetical protein
VAFSVASLREALNAPNQRRSDAGLRHYGGIAGRAQLWQTEPSLPRYPLLPRFDAGGAGWLYLQPVDPTPIDLYLVDWAAHEVAPLVFDSQFDESTCFEPII